MEIINKLAAFAAKLEEKGLMSLASDVDGASAAFIKVAKELGPQGYWVQNGRCWQGCYRKKRASKPRTSAQDIWFECLEEYKKALSGDESKWNKYAGSDETIKTAESVKFSEEISNRMDGGSDIGTSVFATVSTNIAERYAESIDAAETLARVSIALEEYPSLAKEAAEYSSEMLREAGFMDGVKNFFGKGPLQPKNIGSVKNLEYMLSQLDTTLGNYKKQYKTLKGAIAQAQIPDGLKQSLTQGMKMLSSESIAKMRKDIQEFMVNQPARAKDELQNQQADKLHEMVGPQANPGANKALENPDLNSPNPENFSKALLKLKADPVKFQEIISKLPPNLAGLLKAAKRNLFNLVTAQFEDDDLLSDEQRKQLAQKPAGVNPKAKVPQPAGAEVAQTGVINPAQEADVKEKPKKQNKPSARVPLPGGQTKGRGQIEGVDFVRNQPSLGTEQSIQPAPNLGGPIQSVPNAQPTGSPLSSFDAPEAQPTPQTPQSSVSPVAPSPKLDLSQPSAKPGVTPGAGADPKVTPSGAKLDLSPSGQQGIRPNGTPDLSIGSPGVKPGAQVENGTALGKPPQGTQPTQQPQGQVSYETFWKNFNGLAQPQQTEVINALWPHIQQALGQGGGNEQGANLNWDGTDARGRFGSSKKRVFKLG